MEIVGTPRHGRPGRPFAMLAALGVSVVAAGGAIVSAAVANAAPPPHNGKVTLCHATPPATAANGWVEITVSTNAVTHAGHGNHADDIIPAFTYYVKRAQNTYPGKNLSTVFSGSTGAQILANGCRLPAAHTTSSTVPPPKPTHTHTRTTTHTVPAPPPTTHTVTRTKTKSAPPPVVSTSKTVVVHAPASTAVVRATATASAKAVVVHAAASQGIDAAAAGGHSPDARGLAVGDTGDHGGGGGSSAGVYAAVVGGAVAGLLGLAGLAYWRRRTSGAGA